MAVLNVTPDSFSDGGHWNDSAAAVARGRMLASEGADIIDVGGESSRPGAESVSESEELARILPVVEQLSAAQIQVSVDTCKPPVARAALEVGAQIVNDISGLSDEMLEVLAEHDAVGVCMHMQGKPRTMQNDPHYDDVVGEVCDFLAERVRRAREFGVDVIVDPGIGFGKSHEHNLRLLQSLGQLKAFGAPILIGVSRKSFLGRLTGREVDQRLAATLACNALGLVAGADILRVHDVAEHHDLVRVFDALTAEDRGSPTGEKKARVASDTLRLEIEGIEVWAHVGVPSKERSRKQPVRVSVEADLPVAPEFSDRLADTVDYAAVVDRVRTVVSERPRRLLETLSFDIARALTKTFALENVRVRVGKPEIDAALGVSRLDVSGQVGP